MQFCQHRPSSSASHRRRHRIRPPPPQISSAAAEFIRHHRPAYTSLLLSRTNSDRQSLTCSHRRSSLAGRRNTHPNLRRSRWMSPTQSSSFRPSEPAGIRIPMADSPNLNMAGGGTESSIIELEHGFNHVWRRRLRLIHVSQWSRPLLGMTQRD
ncbi:heat shock protein DnaJ with tetratricopeptiderepeat [Striga asiatica]|uniref:Heat shock protein DnaJ with tetratricopeptiderepeat n=1 Tax=Striga asiatica TaxID=4170 RepID=A0A5A7PVU5_STRAF|nr:heat shock protein DnaJ with tetratricopeptiderepeat [Striga asiatica]